MGRPLNKKYFGNRNIGSTSTTADNGIGGQGVLSVTLDALGAYTTRPTITFPLPTLPNGVRATGTITSEVESVTATGGTQTGYTVGQLVSVDGYDAVLRVASVGGTGGDDALTFDFTGGSRGNFTSLPTGALTTLSNGAGAGLTVTLRFRAKAVVITEAGSGYVSGSIGTGDLTFTQSVTALAVDLTSDSGAPGSSTNQENAIVMYANITGAGTTAYPVDIIKQVSTNRYKVTDGTYTGIVELTRDTTPETGYGYIEATDSAGGTYYVMKLTAHKATIRQGTGTQFESWTSVPWTFGSATLDTSVKIENA